MKTKLSKIVMSLIAVVIAVSGTFVSHASEKNSKQIVTCWITPPNSSDICDIIVDCGHSSRICTIIYQGVAVQAFGKINPNDTVCPLICFARD